MRLWAIVATIIFTQISPAFSVGTSPYAEIEFHLSTFSKELTQQTVSQSFQDSRGTLWIVTQEGLNKYTGHTLENYRYSLKNRGSLSTDAVTRIAEDSNGDLWISTLGGGLNKYNPTTKSFTHLFSIPGNTHSPYSNDIHTIYSDLNGQLWLGYTNGFSSFNPANERFVHYVSDRDGIP